MKTIRRIAVFAVFGAVAAGCGKGRNKDEEKPRPRPVSVLLLEETNPQRFDRLSATVASWKTEGIGFEVEGRVNFVVEPDTEIVGALRDKDGKLVAQPTLLATLVTTRYRLREQSASAQVDVVKSQKKAVAIEVARVVPAEIRAAKAEQKRATRENSRVEKAFLNKAVTESKLDQSRAAKDKADATVAQYEAKQESKNAEEESLEAQIQQAKQTLAEAKQDLKDCELFSPFRGRISEVHVIPGGFAKRGEPVLTVQMMDPIKVEVEVDAKTDGRIKYEDILPVIVTQADGTERTVPGRVYQKSTTANPDTRTYSVTLLLKNEILKTQVPEKLKGKPLARVKRVWGLRFVHPKMPSYYLIDAKAIHRDQQGAYLWKILNRTQQTAANDTSPVLKVAKLRVTAGNQHVPFLGLVTVRAVKLENEGEFRRGVDLIVGELLLPKQMSSFDGDTVLLDQSSWLLRPGDVVGVDVSGRPQRKGFYVPMNAIREQSGKTWVFSAEPKKGGGYVARRIEVRTEKSTGTLMRIEPAGKTSLKADMQLIVDGVHFLVDGEAVAVSKRVEVRR